MTRGERALARARGSRYATCVEAVRWFLGAAVLVACTLSCDGESEGDGDGGSPSGGESMSGGGSLNGGNSGNPTGGSDTGGTSSGGSSNGGNSGNSTGGSDSGGTSGGGTSGGGTSGGGTSGGGTSGTGGSDDVDCSGAFGTPRTVLEIFDMQLSALTLSPDELELIYHADTLGRGNSALYSARRASKTDMFSNPIGLPELDAACTNPLHTRSGDLSFDGLTFYFACYLSTERQPLRVARRTSLDAPFVLDLEPIGELIAGPSVSRDELELFSALADVPAMRLGRDDISEPFGPAEPVAGFEMLALATPEIAANGRDIFVSQTTTGGPSYGIARATRSGPGAAFGPLEWVLPETPGESLRSPAISNDCRSLYYVNDTANPRAYRVDVVTR